MSEHAAPKPTTKHLAKDTQQLTVYVPADVADAARNAVIATSGHAKGYRNLSSLVADAVAEKIERLQKQFNNGKEFPERTTPIRRGAPLR